MLWIVLAAQLSMPVAVGVPIPDVRAIFSADDMPVYVQEAGITRFVPTRTTVRTDGRPQDCTVERSSGDPKLDAYTCALILKRARFEPAKWIDGSPAYAVVRTPVTWAINGAPSDSEVEKAFPPDMTVSVNRLPPSAGKSAKVALTLAVDENGRVVRCDERPASKEFHPKSYPQLLPIACRQMESRFTANPAKDASGRPVQSVQTAWVEFSTGG